MDIPARQGAVMLYETTMKSPVGPLRIIASDEGLRAVLWLDDHPSRTVVDGPTTDGAHHPIVADTVAQLTEYFAGERTVFDLSLDLRGTEFQTACWRALTEIPYGSTVSYGEQAETIGRPTAVRAVGAANGRNPISIVVPCHRVVASNGALTGYAGGLDTKQWLLEHEQGRPSTVLA
jgi:methylated-DNA-[protein]-cysteine S-methyltransferase